MTILIALIIFLEILEMVVFLDVILSWLTLFGLKLRPQLLKDLIDPMYKKIRSIIPTRIGVLDLTPIIVIFGIIFLQGLVYTLFPELKEEIFNLVK